ncbi:MAG: serine protease [Acidimicrobiales bacterium]
MARSQDDVPTPPRRRSPALVAGLALTVATALVGGWAQPAAAIVGGQQADPGEWPWHVQVLVHGGQYCGGSLLGADVVVTAAHCLEDLGAGDLSIEAGSVRHHGPDAQRRNVARVVVHEGYDPVLVENDIALLVLDAPVKLGRGVALATIPDKPTAATLTGDGAPAVTTGFGATETADSSDVLLEATVQIYADLECRAKYAEDGDEVIAATQVCAGIDAGGVDSCYGDSGGPLVVPSRDGSTWYLIGIVSWAAGCGVPERPTIYTEVPSFTGWLAGHGLPVTSGAQATAVAATAVLGVSISVGSDRSLTAW